MRAEQDTSGCTIMIETREVRVSRCLRFQRMIDEGDAVGAVKALLKELVSDPGYTGAFHNLGLAFTALDQLELAKAAFELYLEIEPAGYWSLQARDELARMMNR